MKKINYLIQILILLLLIAIVFKAWFISGVVSAGDSWYYFPSMYGNHFLSPYSWYTQSMSTGLGGQGFAYVNTYMVVALLLETAKFFNSSWDFISRVGLYLLFLLISSASSIFLIKKLFPENDFFITAPLIFIFNTYLLMTVGGGQIITALSYSLMPFSIYAVFRLIDSEDWRVKLKFAFLVSLFFSLQAILDLRIAFVTTIASVIYLLISLVGSKFNINLKSFLFFCLAFLILSLICAYWLIPILFYGIDPIQQLGADYSSSSIVRFLSFSRLENSFGLMHPYFPENIFGKVGFMKPEFLILPIIAFLSLLFLDKDKKNSKKILFFASIGLIGIFLGKGASEPFGNIYLFLFQHIPGFQLFRDSIKWYTLVVLSFSILIPFTLYNISKILENRFHKKFIFYILELIFILYFMFLIRPIFLGQPGGTFETREVPVEYAQLNSFLSEQNQFYRTFWVPNTMLFGYYSNLNPQISSRDYLKQYTQKNLYEKISVSEVNSDVDNASVKYVIVPQDTEHEIFLTDRKYDEKKYQEAIDALDKVTWLKRIKSFGKITVYENKEFKDHFWCDCNAEVNYSFINPTKYKVVIKNASEGGKLIFSEGYDSGWVMQNKNYSAKSIKFANKFNSFILPKGSSEYDIYYLPQKLVNIGVLISLITLFSVIVSVVVLIILTRREK